MSRYQFEIPNLNDPMIEHTMNAVRSIIDVLGSLRARYGWKSEMRFDLWGPEELTKRVAQGTSNMFSSKKLRLGNIRLAMFTQEIREHAIKFPIRFVEHDLGLLKLFPYLPISVEQRDREVLDMKNDFEGLEASRKRVEDLLQNSDFLLKAPVGVLQSAQRRLDNWTAKCDVLRIIPGVPE